MMMDARTYRALKAATVVMGVMILAGVVLLGVALARRDRPAMALPAGGAIALHEPAGTRIVGIATAGPSLAVALTGGGPDRVLLLDPASLRPLAEARLVP